MHRGGKKGRLIRLVVLVLSLLVTTLLWYYQLNAIDSTEDRESMVQASQVELSWQEAFPLMASQSEVLTNWGVALVASLAALAVTTKVHFIKGLPWIYLLLAPAASLLLGSLRAGVLFQQTMNYQVLHQDYSSANALNCYLNWQYDFFYWSLVLLLFFALAFFAQIILGAVHPIDEP